MIILNDHTGISPTSLPGFVSKQRDAHVRSERGLVLSRWEVGEGFLLRAYRKANGIFQANFSGDIVESATEWSAIG